MLHRHPGSLPASHLTRTPVPHSSHLHPRYPLPPPRRLTTRRLRRPLRPLQPGPLQTKIRRRYPHPPLEPLPRPPARSHHSTPCRRPGLHQQPVTPHPPRHRKKGKLRSAKNYHRYPGRHPPLPRRRRNQRRHASPRLRRQQPPAGRSVQVLSHPELIPALRAKTIRLPTYCAVRELERPPNTYGAPRTSAPSNAGHQPTRSSRLRQTFTQPTPNRIVTRRHAPSSASFNFLHLLYLLYRLYLLSSSS